MAMIPMLWALCLQNIYLDHYTYQFPIRKAMGSKSVDGSSILLNIVNSAEPKVWYL